MALQEIISLKVMSHYVFVLRGQYQIGSTPVMAVLLLCECLLCVFFPLS